MLMSVCGTVEILYLVSSVFLRAYLIMDINQQYWMQTLGFHSTLMLELCLGSLAERSVSKLGLCVQLSTLNNINTKGTIISYSYAVFI